VFLIIAAALTLGAPFGIAAALQAHGGRIRRASWFVAGLVFGPYAVLTQYFVFHETGEPR
jgi:hypothetical protein